MQAGRGLYHGRVKTGRFFVRRGAANGGADVKQIVYDTPENLFFIRPLTDEGRETEPCSFLFLGMMHIHVWERFDSRFRLVTARRNPNMVILFTAMLFSRPDLGLIAVAWWTAVSCAVHAVRLAQAEVRRARGGAITSWLAGDGR